MSRTRARWSFGLLSRVIAVLVLSALPASSQPGTLDLTFDADGKVITPFSTETDQLHELALQADGKIVAAGWAQFDGIAVSRYNPDGSLDLTFGGDGTVTSGFGRAYGLVVQSGGRIVIVAQIGGDFAVVGYTTLGILDPTFGTLGVASTDFFGNEDRAFAIALQPDDKIVVGGQVIGVNGLDFGIARYNADGSLDPTFGDGGKVNTNFSIGHEDVPSSDVVYAIALQEDGKIVVAGRSAGVVLKEGQEYPAVFSDFALARYDSDGALDLTFGDGGAVTTDFFGNVDGAFAVAVQSDGKIVAAGVADPGGTERFGLVRYRTDGVLDDTFGNGGIVATDLLGFDESADALVLQQDGKIVAAGHGSQDFAIARYELDGSLDTTFDGDGVLTIDFAASTDNANALLLQADGKIVVGGYARVASNDEDFALARLNMEPGDPPTSVEGSPSTAAFALMVFPNPSRGQVTLMLRMDSSPQRARARILDVAGRVVHRWEPPLGVSSAADRVVASWSWESLGADGLLTSGVYFAEVDVDGLVSSRKILVSR